MRHWKKSISRFTCYFCDVHFCSNCVELAIKVDDTRIDKDKEQSGGGGLTDSPEQNIGKIEVKLDSADDGDNQLDLSNTNTAFLFAGSDITFQGMFKYHPALIIDVVKIKDCRHNDIWADPHDKLYEYEYVS